MVDPRGFRSLSVKLSKPLIMNMAAYKTACMHVHAALMCMKNNITDFGQISMEILNPLDFALHTLQAATMCMYTQVNYAFIELQILNGFLPSSCH